MLFFDRTILLINLGVITATVLAYMATQFSSKVTWIISVFGLFFPVLLIINVLFILYWIVKRPKYVWPSVLCLLIGWSAVKGFVGFNSSDSEISSEALNIMTLNISHASFAYDRDRAIKKVKRHDFVEYFKQYRDLDIFMLQEVGDYAYEILKEIFSKHHIHYIKKGAVIVSKYPIIKKGEINFETITNSCVWADIRLPHDTLRVYSFHLYSNRVSVDAEELAHNPRTDSKKAWYDIKSIIKKVRDSHYVRIRQAQMIKDHAAETEHTLILGGDLNDPPQSYTYKMMTDMGQDAFKVRGSGLGTTYAGIIPLLRIDYLFVDEDCDIRLFDVIDTGFSDHYAVRATIDIKK